MIAYLFESTLFLAVAILVARTPRLAAQTRYAVVFAGLMKFSVPSAIVPSALARLGIDLARIPKGTIVIDAIGPLAAAALPATATSRWPLIAMAIWLTVAATLLARALLGGRAAVRRAVADGRDADADELAALERARARTALTRPVRLLCSSLMATPATAGILSPIIIIPAATALTGPELETILTHECAHIARRDNLLSLIESVAGCALWFHPLVWIARRVLDATREEACDAIVIASGDAGTYITALGKVCDAAILPRTAALSCIVSNTIRERMEAIMRFGTQRLLNHRAVTATVIALLAVATLGIGVARAVPAESGTNDQHKVDATLTRGADGIFLFAIAVRDRATGETIASARLKARAEQPGTIDASNPDVHIRAIAHEDGTADVEARFAGEATIVTRIVANTAPAAKTSRSDTISIDLKDADIRDVLKTFSQLTNTEIVVDDNVSGRVTVDFHDIPWTKALDIILHMNDLSSERIGTTIHVHRK
jgi:beta-lactamase regulating signal transducer with metallopeptidase domain